jgi:hypothetical protein
MGWPILVDKPEEFFKRSKRSKHPRRSYAPTILLGDFRDGRRHNTG